MGTPPTTRRRLEFTLIAFLLAAAHLAWEHFNGGIRSHHFMGNANYPAMHNAWSLLILPALTWMLTRRVASEGIPRAAIATFSAALLYGIALSVAFSVGAKPITSALFFSIFGLCFLLPIYRAMSVLGFVFGMTFTFGPFIPLVFAVIFAALSAFAHLVLYRFAKSLTLRLLQKTNATSAKP